MTGLGVILPGNNNVSGAMGKKKYYVVWVGRQRGLFSAWEACKAAVEGYKGAKYMGFDTLSDAEIALQSTPLKFFKKRQPAVKGESGNDATDKPAGRALTVDAACSGNPGVLEYRGVWLESGTEYFRMGPYPEGTINIGEFLAVVHGLAQLKRNGLEVPVYSDSKTALKWIRDKKANTRLVRSAGNARLFELIGRAEKWLQENDYPNPVLKWDTASWGEIPADFGRK